MPVQRKTSHAGQYSRYCYQKEGPFHRASFMHDHSQR